MATENSKFPQWLNFLLDSTVGEQCETCRKHHRKDEDVFCSKCMTFECKKCFKSSKRHDDHKSCIIQIYGCSIKYDVIEKLNWSKSPKIRTSYSSYLYGDDGEALVPLNSHPNHNCQLRNYSRPAPKHMGFMDRWNWNDYGSRVCSVRCKLKLEQETETKRVQDARMQSERRSAAK